MVYPGNDALSPEIRQRIHDTFRQTLDLAEKGSRQEALLGCDFILRLDPAFEPARALAKRLDEGSEVQVDDLREAFQERVDSLDDTSADPEPPQAAADRAPQSPAAAAPAAPTPPPAAPEAEDPMGDLELPPEPAASELDLDDLFDSSAPPAGSVQEAPPKPAAPEQRPQPATPPAEPAPPPGPQPAAQASAAEAAPSLGGDDEDLLGEPEVALDSESRQRIQQLLDEGQAAFDRMEHQAAIDAWSRIFLIDIEHPEASRRIELARKLKAELERSVEEAMHEGISHVEQGDLDSARTSFQKVLEMVPQHATALEYLERMDRNETPAPPEAPGAEPERGESEASPSADARPKPAAAASPKPDTAPARPRPRPASRPRTTAPRRPQRSRGRLFAYLGAAVLLVVVAAGWFLLSNRQRFFPNAAEPVETVRSEDPIGRAKTLYEDGKQSIAIAQLRRLGPDSPDYAEAQALIFQWESGINQESGGPDPDEELRLQREQIIERARGAYSDGDYFRAEELLRQAEQLAPFEGIETGFVDLVRERIEPVRSQLEVFKQGEWEMALRDLWRIHEQAPRDPVVVQLMVDCYYNLGVRALQRGDTASAAERFGEALDLAPGRPELQRLTRFATLYTEKPQDLLYRIFVKYLPFR